LLLPLRDRIAVEDQILLVDHYSCRECNDVSGHVGSQNEIITKDDGTAHSEANALPRIEKLAYLIYQADYRGRKSEVVSAQTDSESSRRANLLIFLKI
jgi:hypothetical protein